MPVAFDTDVKIFYKLFFTISKLKINGADDGGGSDSHLGARQTSKFFACILHHRKDQVFLIILFMKWRWKKVTLLKTGLFSSGRLL